MVDDDAIAIARDGVILFANIRRADSFGARLRGLMFAAPLAPDAGLLLQPCASVHTVGMRAPIDVIFLDEQLTVLRCVARLKPCRSSACSGAWQTLEVAAGSIARHDIGVGQRLHGVSRL